MRHVIHFTGIFIIIGIFLIGCDAVVDIVEETDILEFSGVAGIQSYVYTCDYTVNEGESIQDAIDNASPGATICVMTGYFEEQQASFRDIFIDKSLNLIGAGSGQTIVGLRQAVNNGVEVSRIDGAALDIVIEGFTFTKRNGADHASPFNLRFGESNTTFNTLVLRDVEVKWAKGRNVFLDGNGTYNDILVENSKFHTAGAWGFSARGVINSMHVKDSNFDNNGWDDPAHGIGFDIDLPMLATNITVEGGSFSNNERRGINLNAITNATFTDVTASNNKTVGINLWNYTGNSNNVTFTNVTANNNRDGIQMAAQNGYNIENISIIGGTFNNNSRIGIYHHPAKGTSSKITIDGASVSGSRAIDLRGEGGNPISTIKVLNTTVGVGPGNGILALWANGVEIIGNTVSGRTANGIAVVYGSMIEIENNISQNNVATGVVLATVTNGTIKGNTLHNNPGNDPNFGSLTIRENCQNITAENNKFTGSTYGAWVHETSSVIAINNNNITDNTTGIKNESVDVVDARYNWWGHASGPGGPDGRTNPAGRTVGRGDAIIGNVDFNPWLNRSINHPSRR